MPTFEFDLPQESFDFLKELGDELGVSPSQALDYLIGRSTGSLTNDQAAVLAEATLAKAGECVVPDEAYWEKMRRRVREAAMASRARASKVG